MSDRHELEMIKEKFSMGLPQTLGSAALINAVGMEAGLLMDVDPHTELPRCFSSAKELTERFIKEAQAEVANLSPYAFEENDPSAYVMMNKILGKARDYKAGFATSLHDRSGDGLEL